jgi:hypothetical protein
LECCTKKNLAALEETPEKAFFSCPIYDTISMLQKSNKEEEPEREIFMEGPPSQNYFKDSSSLNKIQVHMQLASPNPLSHC